MLDNLSLLRKFKKIYPKGSIIIYEYDEGNEIYYIIKGKVKVSKISNLKEKVIAYLKNGDFFGEMAVFDSCQRSATVTAIEEVEALVLRKEDFFYLMKLEPSIMVSMIQELSKRYINTETQLNNITSKNSDEKFLNYINEKYKEEKNHNLPLVIDINEIVALLNVKHDELKEILNEYKKHGYLKYDENKIYLEFMGWIDLNIKKSKF